MTQYIDKSALLAEIEKLVNKLEYHQGYACGYRDGTNDTLDALKEKINTIEVKEVDLELEKELVDYHNENFSTCNDGTLLSCETGSELTWYDYERIAKHFFELGLKATHEGE